MNNQQYDQLTEIAYTEAVNYLTKKNYFNFEYPHQLDGLIVDCVSDFLDGKMTFLVLGAICEILADEPLHHMMDNNSVVYTGVEISYYFLQKDHLQLNKTRDILEKWYDSI